jgi:outer membrane lipoprotein-sorting protein
MKRFFVLFVMTLNVMMACAQSGSQQNEARKTFDKVYNMVFGPQGSTLRYDVNIIGLYKTHGTIWYKGKKQRFSDERVNTWNDGTTAYMVFRKKKTVEIHEANSDKKDKYSGKFKFSLDDFDYSMKKEGTDLLFILKQHKKAKGTIKEVRALVDAKTLAPKFVKLKVALFWAKIKISNFKSGGISDDMFVFPAKNYKEGYKWIDKRNE